MAPPTASRDRPEKCNKTPQRSDDVMQPPRFQSPDLSPGPQAGHATQAQQGPGQWPAQNGHAKEGQRGPRQPQAVSQWVFAQGRHQFQTRGQHQARHHGAHAAQCGLRRPGVGNAVVQGRQAEHQGARHQQESRERGQGATHAKFARADHDREVDHIGARQGLGDRPVLDELLSAEPLLLFDQFALNHRQHAAKALQGHP